MKKFDEERLLQDMRMQLQLLLRRKKRKDKTTPFGINLMRTAADVSLCREMVKTKVQRYCKQQQEA